MNQFSIFADLNGERTRYAGVTVAVRRKGTTTMGNISRFGLLTCAGLYFAIGLFGVVFFGVQQNLSPQQNSASTADGYGIIHIAAQSPGPTTARPGF
jgi:hypothetical protein